jgi:hypothetical protein
MLISTHYVLPIEFTVMFRLGVEVVFKRPHFFNEPNLWYSESRIEVDGNSQEGRDYSIAGINIKCVKSD